PKERVSPLQRAMGFSSRRVASEQTAATSFALPVDSVRPIRYHARVADLVDAKPLSGFQDLLPPDALAFERAVERTTAVFRRHGYLPIDTPCIYRYETLTGGRAGIDKQLFEWRKKQEGAAGERGPGEHVALRFDLTVPLARYLASNASRLTFP